MFTTEFDRTARMLSFPDGTAAELALDRGDIRAGRRAAPISEAEIELKTGDAIRLFEVARELAQDVPLRLGHASKAERGYALARARAGAAEGAQHSARRTPLGRCRAPPHRSACIAQMQANEEGLLKGKDPEYLHQLRVGLRRLRAASRARRSRRGKQALAAVAEELRWLQNTLGPARDWDVFMSETFPPLARTSMPEQRAWRGSARAARGSARAHARPRAKQYVRSATLR